jgi:hypothetical protein
MYGSESSELKSGKESESVRVAPQLLRKIPLVSDGARLVLAESGVQSGLVKVRGFVFVSC